MVDLPDSLCIRIFSDFIRNRTWFNEIVRSNNPLFAVMMLTVFSRAIGKCEF
jgi:hypothetical protein